MAKTLSLQILTPVSVLLTANDIAWVQVTLTNGSLGILPGHTALLAATTNAPLRYQDSQTEHSLNLAEGILQIKANTVTIFTRGLQNEADMPRIAAANESRFQRLTTTLLTNLTAAADTEGATPAHVKP